MRIPKSKNNTKDQTIDPKSLRAKLYRLFSLTLKEINILLNDKMAFVLLLMFPLVIVLFVNFGSSGMMSDPGENYDPNMPVELRFTDPIIGIIDNDRSEGYGQADLSAEFVFLFREMEDRGDCILEEGHSRTELEGMLGRGEIHGYVIVDEGFEYNISTHFVGMFTVVVDSYDTFVMQDVLWAVDQVVTQFQEKFDFHGAISFDNSLVNLSEKGQMLKQMTPYFYPLLCFAMTLLIETQSLVSDIPKDRMVLTPAKKGEILTAKFLGGVVVNSTIAFVLVFLTLALGMEIQNNAMTFLLVFESGVIVATAFGLFFSSISDTTLAGFQYALVVIIVQEILMLFITNDVFLSFFPLYAIQECYGRSIIQGTPLLLTGNTLGIPYIFYVWVETIISLLGAYFIYKFKKSVI